MWWTVQVFSRQKICSSWVRSFQNHPFAAMTKENGSMPVGSCRAGESLVLVWFLALVSGDLLYNGVAMQPFWLPAPQARTWVKFPKLAGSPA